MDILKACIMIFLLQKYFFKHVLKMTKNAIVWKLMRWCFCFFCFI